MPERLECEVLQKARYINTLTFTRGGAPIGAGGSWPPLFEAKGGGGHNLGIIHMHCYLFIIKHTAHYKHTVSL